MVPIHDAWPGESLDDIKAKIAECRRACVVLDDSSGGDHPSLERGRRLWAGVIFSEPEAAAVMAAQAVFQRQPPTAKRIWRLGDDRRAIVFHFTDLWSGNGLFRGWSFEDRLMWIRLYGESIVELGLPVYVVQRSLTIIEILRKAGKVPSRTIPLYDPSNPDHNAFLTLLATIQKGLVPSPNGITAVSDRGARDGVLTVLRRSDGTPLMDWLTPPGILHESTAVFPLLQYADLVAWGYSRMELASARGIQNEYERQLLDVLVEVSRGWATIRVDSDGREEVWPLAHFDWPGPLS